VLSGGLSAMENLVPFARTCQEVSGKCIVGSTDEDPVETSTKEAKALARIASRGSFASDRSSWSSTVRSPVTRLVELTWRMAARHGMREVGRNKPSAWLTKACQCPPGESMHPGYKGRGTFFRSNVPRELTQYITRNFPFASLHPYGSIPPS